MKKLFRSRVDRKLAGVLGGIAQMLGVDSTIIRVLFIILLFPTGFFPLAITYLLLMFVMPNEEDVYR
ncbi:MAG: PspC domain-containing protein [Bacillales bacterium]|nr:PspC domain-containing protein [Bacillales bacterium]